MLAIGRDSQWQAATEVSGGGVSLQKPEQKECPQVCNQRVLQLLLQRGKRIIVWAG